MRDFEAGYQEKLRVAEQRILQLEEENRHLHHEIEHGTAVFGDATDETLQKRLANLSGSPLDTIIREAGVVFENRLRQVAGEAGSQAHGVERVDVVLRPQNGILMFSKHSGEQDGIRLLYRGAMQYIRNPPMHNLIEFQASMAQTQLRLIDTLLKLLAEGRSRKEEEAHAREENLVSLADVRRMLTRLPIPESQMLFYKVLHQAGEKGITGNDLAQSLNRNRYQLAGVLGALGLRVNGTAGLENKGGLQIIVDISRLRGGDYRYRMRPILQKALEEEHVLQL